MAKEIMSTSELDNTLNRLVFQILEACPDPEKTALVGIRRGGAFLAERLKSKIDSQKGCDIRFGLLDITLYRDDLTQIAEYPVIHGTEIDFTITGLDIVLVDDVVFTGRTTRAALDALTDLGRPSRIFLTALIDRGHRELPVQPDFTGKYVPTSLDEIVHVKLEEKDGTDQVLIDKKGA